MTVIEKKLSQFSIIFVLASQYRSQSVLKIKYVGNHLEVWESVVK